MSTGIDLTAALAVVKGVRQRAWLEALTSDEGLHPTDSRRRYGSVTAERIELLLGRLYAAGYTIERSTTPPQRTPRWHVTGWEGAEAAAERQAEQAVCVALGRRVVPQALHKLRTELADAGRNSQDLWIGFFR